MVFPKIRLKIKGKRWSLNFNLKFVVNNLLKKYNYTLKPENYKPIGLKSLVKSEVPTESISVNSVDSDEKIPLRIGYPIKEDPVYLKAVYLSLLSQCHRTDISQVDSVTVFVPEKFKDVADDLFSIFENSELNFRILSRSAFITNYTEYRLTRQSLINHGLLRVDCSYVTPSQFSLFKSVPNNFYKKIHIELQSENIIGVVKKKGKPFKKEAERAGMFYDVEEVKTFFQKRLNMSDPFFQTEVKNRKSWLSNKLLCLSDRFLFEKGKYREEWRRYSTWTSYYQITDLGLVVTPFFVKNHLKPKKLKNVSNEFKNEVKVKDIVEDSLTVSYLRTEVNSIDGLFNN